MTIWSLIDLESSFYCFELYCPLLFLQYSIYEHRVPYILNMTTWITASSTCTWPSLLCVHLRASRISGTRRAAVAGRPAKWAPGARRTRVSSGGCQECCSSRHSAQCSRSPSASCAARCVVRRAPDAHRPPAPPIAPRARPPELATLRTRRA